MDCDRTMNCGFEPSQLKALLAQQIEQETEQLRTYTSASERIHGNAELKDRLQNFAEGNAKRSKQLIDELNRMA